MEGFTLHLYYRLNGEFSTAARKTAGTNSVEGRSEDTKVPWSSRSTLDARVRRFRRCGDTLGSVQSSNFQIGRPRRSRTALLPCQGAGLVHRVLGCHDQCLGGEPVEGGRHCQPIWPVAAALYPAGAGPSWSTPRATVSLLRWRTGPGAGPGGHCGASQESSVVDLPPHIDTSDQPLPGPAEPTLGPASTSRKTDHQRNPKATD